MPVQMSIIDGGKGIYKKFTGLITGAEIMENTAELIAKCNSEGAFKYYLNDFLEAKELQITNNEVRRMSAFDGDFLKNNPKVLLVVCATQDFIFALGRMWESHVEVRSQLERTKIFHSLEEAKHWIVETLGEELNFS